MTFIKVNDVQMYYEKAGHGEITLLLIHGNLGSARWWDSVWGNLADSFTVVRMDLRGCGRSEKPGDGYTIPQYSEDIQALVHSLDCRNVILAGHSMGGAIAMDIAVSRREEDRYKGMVLVNSAPAEGLVTPEERKPLLEQMIGDRNLMKTALSAVVPTAATGEFFEALVDDAMIAGSTLVSNYTSLSQVDYREELSNIHLPALIVFGTKDSLITLDMMDRTREAISGSEWVLYEGIGHSPNVEAPEDLCEDIRGFIKRKIRL